MSVTQIAALLNEARKLNASAARQVAAGKTPTPWDNPAMRLDALLERIEDKVGTEATDQFRSELADQHASIVTEYTFVEADVTADAVSV